MTKASSKTGNTKAVRPLKRKLEQAFEQVEHVPTPLTQMTVLEMQTAQIQQLVANLKLVPGIVPDKTTLRKTAHQLAELCKQEDLVDALVNEGAIEAVVPLLYLDNHSSEASGKPANEDLEKEACFILGLLAVKPEYQARIAKCNALPGLVRLLKEHRNTSVTKAQPGSGGAARRAADAITNLAHENSDIKNAVRDHGGVPPLVSLLEAMDLKVQRAAAGALRTLAFKNEGNKNQIVECGALPVLIQMLRSEDPNVHYETVGVIGNLVHSSQHIKRKVLEEGALQPVIALLQSTCPESQREAALLLGQFATSDAADYKAKIVQRGAVPLLVKMLGASDTSLQEMAAFALGRLAQNADNQAGVVQCEGLEPLLELLESKHLNLQHNAAFALYGLADNEDNIPDIIRMGALQRLMDCVEKLQVQASKDCVQKTITRMETKLQDKPRVLAHVVYMLRSNTRVVQQRSAMALAKMAPEGDVKSIFVDKRGLDVLLDMLVDQSLDAQMLREAANAVLDLAHKIKLITPLDAAPAQDNKKTVYLGVQYVNNPTLADVTFIVEGRKFHAHRIALLASSDIFRAMFNGGYREKEAASIDIPNIPWAVFESMMTYIYTGHVEVAADIATELLEASDQYLLEGLKRLCELCIAQQLTVDNLMETFELSERHSAPQLARRCGLFVLEHYTKVTQTYDASVMFNIMSRMLPHLRSGLLEDATKAAAKND